ncbi:MAG: DUF362 domain-containing protein [Halanaerobiaceae bacterium]|jgi:uncharacterized protein (DUF362 family)/NAD-dependent dihydropyrimidine dehydrogenase PreA subunit|nr:DUF362 domain-containing protein [Halanaerobiaceae bacterium]
METVIVKHCDNYDERLVDKKISQIFEELGGIGSFVKPGQKVLLKVNLLMDKPAEAMVTTHPLVVKAVAKLVRDAGANPVIGDSPGGPFSRILLERAYQKTGLKEIAEETGIELNYEIEQEKVSFDGKLNKSFVLGKFVTDAELVINLAKLKTHGLTMMTGAVKNLFGTVPGLLKAEYHLKMPRLADFSEMLVELALCVNPVLNIVDGIWGMEGEGPSAGRIRQFSYLFAGSSAFAVDTVLAYFLGINPVNRAPVIDAARKRGLCSSMEEIRLIGDELIPPGDVEIPLPVENSNLIDRRLPEGVSRILEPLLKPRPVFLPEKCTGCRVCYQSCPPQAIRMNHQKAEVVLDECIRCFCCQELCKYQAVKIKRPLLGKILTK